MSEFKPFTTTYIFTKRNAEIRSFASALAFIREELGESVLSVGDEAYIAKRSQNVKLRVLQCENGSPTHIGVVLYQTTIITYRSDETFTCNSGGYYTPTTVMRLNQFSPKPYEHRFGHGDRTLFVGGKWADMDMNRFQVNSFAIGGEEIAAPKLKTKSAKVAYGTLRWFKDTYGNIFSTNSLHRGKIAGAILDYEAIGKNGDYTAPFQYDLEIIEDSSYIKDMVGVAKSNVPLDIVNLHRVKWGMPEIRVVQTVS